MKKITKAEAEELNNEGIKSIKLLEPENPLAQEATERMFSHTKLVANAAELIASEISGMDIEKAYIYGILHDYGKYFGDVFGKKTFHGLQGYIKLMNMGYSDVAKINLTHTFIEKDFVIEEYSTYFKPDLVESKKILNQIEYDDYDRLIQLCDLLPNQYGGYLIFEERFGYIKEAYGLSDEIYHKRIRAAVELKKYFEGKTGCDIYELLGVDNG